MGTGTLRAARIVLALQGSAVLRDGSPRFSFPHWEFGLTYFAFGVTRAIRACTIIPSCGVRVSGFTFQAANPSDSAVILAAP